MDSTDQAYAGAAVPAITYTSEERSAHPDEEAGPLMVLLALSHTPAEHQLYLALLRAAAAGGSPTVEISVRHLMVLSSLHDFSAVRRARAGLERKLSVECRQAEAQGLVRYTVREPGEIFTRRREAGLGLHPDEWAAHEGRRPTLGPALGRALRARSLSRRECQVALHCAEGCTNAEISERLGISEDTVKFHLRHVFAKLGVRRRIELVSRLLADG